MTAPSLSLLDLYALILIKSGVTTPYAMQERGGLSVGASLPSLRRMVSLKLVSRSKAAARRRREYSLTPLGISAAKKWREVVEEFASRESWDLESVCRAAAIALEHDELEMAKGFLTQAANRRKVAADTLKPPREPNVGSRYLKLRLSLEKVRLEAERTELLRQSRKIN